jgi:hypothetical protein
MARLSCDSRAPGDGAGTEHLPTDELLTLWRTKRLRMEKHPTRGSRVVDGRTEHAVCLRQAIAPRAS